MSKSWAISGIDLHLDLAGPRRRGALERTLREAVRSGRLPPGTRLPSSRSLAVDLGLARNTVAAAYGQLVAEGWLEGRQGAGTRVALRPVVTAAPAASSPPPSRRPQFDLRPGVPDLAAFPREAWLAATRRALREAPFDALGYGDPRGRIELRRALAEYLARARGVAASPDRILVCSGLVQGLSLIRAALAGPWAVEEYGHAAHRRGLDAVPLRVDDEGAVVSELGDARVALLTPAHQFPLGSTLSPVRRREAVAWARAAGSIVVEDDYDGEFRYDRRPVGAMQALAPEHVVYAGTASKSLAPGVRLGWLVLPPQLLDPVLAARAHGDWPGALEQLTLAELLASGGYDRHVRRMRLAYRRRRDRLASTIGHVSGIEAGLHAVVDVEDDEASVVERARRADLLVEGLDDYRFGARTRGPALVVGYGTPPEHAFGGALERLSAVLVPGTGTVPGI
ncbi:MAG: MocR-like pyridoxine biosynthesis transcription factor PdxR [Gaiellaceae bacterium]